MKQRIGIAGVGLMGHGIARNVLKHGFELCVLEHPGNQPLDELISGGIATVTSGRDLAARSEVIILCVTGSPEVEAVLCDPGGVLEGLQPGAIVIDCSTAIPSSTERMHARVTAAGGRLIDAPMTRTVQHAHAGTLNLLVGADAETLDEVMTLLRSFAENIAHVGGVGAGHRMKLIHNFVSLGMIALLAEASASAARGGIVPEVLIDVLAKGGGGGVALERVAPVIQDPKQTPVPFFMSNAMKDINYYVTMARELSSEHSIADAIAKTYEIAVARGGARAMVTDLVMQLSSGRH